MAPNGLFRTLFCLLNVVILGHTLEATVLYVLLALSLF